jgi:hypothetical protein
MDPHPSIHSVSFIDGFPRAYGFQLYFLHGGWRLAAL